ncbi:hypothetical protein Ccrd_023225 [Cynara cardunculus var. scolymus]|uniref:Methyltransferase n=1 Tax=Cynara cardunculus var. scolymus TaxID=59895 RepID=A0A103XX76_CYNCS|nr:hypothetical protein Ccrd_023225 [Cynara cardunculus var. scolymus]
MSKPLHRGFIGGGRFSGNIQDLQEDTQMKDRTDKQDFDKNRLSSDHVSLSLRNPVGFLFSSDLSSKQNVNENRFLFSDLSFHGNGHKLALVFLKFTLVVIVFLALTVSFWWTISLTNTSRGHVLRGYRRLQEQLVSDLWDIGELSHGGSSLKELEFCSLEFENYVPCFNISENLELGKGYDRHCGVTSKQKCLVLAPVKYKIPHRWPTGRDVIWIDNVKIKAQEVLSSGSFTKRMMMLDEDQISFSFASSMVDDNIEDYSHQIAEMIGLRNESYLVRTILDIGCGYGSLGAHLFQKQLLTMCVANYEASGSQVEITLERGLPAIVGSFALKRLPFPSLSYDMVHSAWDGIEWDQKDGMHLIEVDRVLRPGGYFVWTSPFAKTPSAARKKDNIKRWDFVRNMVRVPWCAKRAVILNPHITIHSRHALEEHIVTGVLLEDLKEDDLNWKSAVRNYWSLLSPLIYSDHPKRPGDEDPVPPYNMVRNVLDMNAHFGGLNFALLEAGKSVWVMNVVPTSGPNFLPLIVDRGFIGANHFRVTLELTIWCMWKVFYRLKMQINGWVILRDTVSLIETARTITARLKWEARVVEIESNSDEKLLVCQKPFLKKQTNSL